ncbi:MAG: hypothetical protein ABIT71_25585 [Vicinamibacteraceae bacterium]
MVKTTLKLVIVGLIANALYQVVPPYYTFLQFRDAIKELATYPGTRAQLPAVLLKCEKIAKEYGLDLTGDDFTVKLAAPGGPQTTTIDVSYEVVMKPIPGRPQPHVFAIHAVGDAPRFGSLTP